MKKILVTGGTGFIGGALLERLACCPDVQTAAWIRRPDVVLPKGVQAVLVSPGSVLPAVDTVIHCAGRVHVMKDTEADPLAAFRETNVELTLRLARQAIASGARRFVFLSSIKVNGESTAPGNPFRAESPASPQDAYAQSKFEAEQALLRLSQETGLQVVIIRTPLVYGPGVRANFQSMMRWLRRGVPLPFGAIDNRRTLVALDNLVDLIETCVRHPAAANETFLAGDAQSLSTTELLQSLAKGMGRTAWLLPVPVRLLRGVAELSGQGRIYQRLCGSLEVDIGKARELLGWEPPVPVNLALARTAQSFLRSER